MTPRPLAVLALFVLMPVSGDAQTLTRAGLGVGLAPGAVLGTVSTHVYVPLAFGTTRVEPGIVLASARRQAEIDGQTRVSSQTAARAEIGVLRELGGSDATRVYVGPRLGAFRITDRYDPLDGEESIIRLTGFSLAGAGGAEHFLSDRFSIGGEAQLIAFLFSEAERIPPSEFFDREERNIVLLTNALFFVRWYFRD